MFADKILKVEQAQQQVAEAKSGGAVVVHCHGVFDLLHPGHFRHLAWAKSQGDVLIVTIPSDGRLRDRAPGANLLSERQRAEHLSQLQVVDYVYVVEQDVLAFLSAAKPDVYVRGAEFANVHDGEFGEQRRLVKSYGGDVRFSSGDVYYEHHQRLGQVVREQTVFLKEQIGEYCRRNHVTQGSIEALFSRFRSQDISVVGETIVDEYVYCDPLGMSSDSPAIVVRPSHAEKFLGGAAIVAQHLAALGAKPRFFSVIGDDAEGEYVRAELASLQLEAYVETDRSRPTIHKKRYLSGGKKMLNVNVFRDQELSAEVSTRLTESIEANSKSASALVISDFSYGVLCAPVVDALYKLRDERNIPLAGDVQSSSQIGKVSRLKGLTTATPSEREARLALWDRESGIADLGVKLLADMRCKTLLITLGAKGLMVFETRGQDVLQMLSNHPIHEIKQRISIEYLPSFADSVVDSMGAGDAMLSAVSLALASGASIAEAAFVGNCASAVEVAAMGNIAVTREQALAVARRVMPDD